MGANDYRWPSVDRMAKSPVLQRIGPGRERIELDGVLFPQFKGDAGQIQSMREAASQRTPHILVDGQGHVFGSWIILQIEETQSVYMADGTPRKIEFKLCLEKQGKENSWIPM